MVMVMTTQLQNMARPDVDTWDGVKHQRYVGWCKTVKHHRYVGWCKTLRLLSRIRMRTKCVGCCIEW